MSNYAAHLGASKKKSVSAAREDAPQSAKADVRQVKNAAGGFTFEVDDWKRLDRFLILGAEGGTFHVGEKKLVKENATALGRCLKDDAAAAVEHIAALSESGRAPKNDAAIFALAVAAAHEDAVVRRLALAALPRVCRTGTHLFEFVAQVEQLRGWGSGLRRAVGAWYTSKEGRDLAYQLLKYQQRGGRSHRDLLRQAHPKTTDPIVSSILRWTIAGRDGLGERSVKRKQQEAGVSYEAVAAGALPALIEGVEKVRAAKDANEAATIIREYGLTHEMVPSEHQKHAVVWDALLQRMPMHACVRNLGRMTANGLLVPGSDASKLVVKQLKNADAIKKSRLHPIAVLLALKTYAAGHGEKGKLTWSPVQSIIDALDDAFYLAFETVEPTGKSIMLALDVSGSMASSFIAGTTLTAREAVGCMAMVTARRESDYDIVGFASGSAGHAAGYGGRWGGQPSRLLPVNITAKTTLPDVIKAMEAVPMGGTDCALPMLHALAQKQKVEAFYVATDNETWAGAVHPHVALKQYRENMGIASKLIVVATDASEFTIADPTDAGMIDVVGFDAAAPAVIADFIRD